MHPSNTAHGHTYLRCLGMLDHDLFAGFFSWKYLNFSWLIEFCLYTSTSLKITTGHHLSFLMVFNDYSALALRVPAELTCTCWTYVYLLKLRVLAELFMNCNLVRFLSIQKHVQSQKYNVTTKFFQHCSNVILLTLNMFLFTGAHTTL